MGLFKPISFFLNSYIVRYYYNEYNLKKEERLKNYDKNRL